MYLKELKYSFRQVKAVSDKVRLGNFSSESLQNEPKAYELLLATVKLSFIALP